MAKRGGDIHGPLRIRSSEAVPLSVIGAAGATLLSLSDAGVLTVGASIDPDGNIGTDVLVATDKKIQFRDTGIYIQSTGDAALSIVSDGNVTIDGATNTVAGPLEVTGLLTVTGLLSALNLSPVARTATVAGDGTGLVADGTGYVAVTASSAAHIITLPTPTPGSVVLLHVGANGYELASDTPASVAINGGTGSGASSSVAAGTFVLAVCVTATAWLAFGIASDGTVAGLEAATT